MRVGSIRYYARFETHNKTNRNNLENVPTGRYGDQVIMIVEKSNYLKEQIL